MIEETILRLLGDLEVLLKTYKVAAWSDEISNLRQEYQIALEEDRQENKEIVLNRVKELFGGMGSFNDYVITHLHGDAILADQEQTVNSYLNALRHELAEVACDVMEKA